MQRVTKNARGGGSKNDLAAAMKLVIAIVFSLTVAILNATERPPLQPQDLAVTETASAQTVNKDAPKQDEAKPAEQAAAPAKPAFDANNPATWPKCAEDEIVRADNGQCAKKPAPQPAAAGVAAVTNTGGDKNARVPYGVHDIGGYGSCAAEIAKYDWGQATALAVARAESQHRPGVINNNPGTGDYSVGCFQVNIYGANARNRPSQAQLIDAAVNVRWAYNNYVANGHSFIGQWGVCRSKVSCY